MAMLRSSCRWLRAVLLFAAISDSGAAQVRLVDAVRAADETAVRALLDQRADANGAGADGTTALHWAAYDDNLEIAELLIRAGAEAGAVNRYGVTPLWLACVNGNAAMIEMLLKAGAGASAVLPEGETMLMAAARTGNVDAVKALLDSGADVNATESWRGQTALMWAAAEGHSGVIRELVRRGAHVSARSDGGFTALLFAARDGRGGAVRALLDAGADLNDSLAAAGRGAGGAEPPAGINAFLLAAGNAHFELAAWLLDQGVDPNTAPQGWTALHQLSWVRKTGSAGDTSPPPEGSGGMSSLDFARKLVAHGADVNARATSRRPAAGGTGLNMLGATPFFMATRTADVEYMRLLVELGADPLLPNEDSTTPLMAVAGIGTNSSEDVDTESELLEALQLALELGNDVNAVDNNGETAMHGAAYKFLPSMVYFLAENGARAEIWNQPNSRGWTPLNIAEGVRRAATIIGSPPTAAAIREVMSSER